MADVKILDKKVRIDVKDAEDNIIGQICFNPDNTQVYSKFLDMMQLLEGKNKEMESIALTDDERAALDKDLSTVEDFEAAAGALGKIKMATDLATETVKEACAGLDSVFGEGICDLFMQGDYDVELLEPLINVVVPYFNKSREGKTNKYKAKK